MQKNLSPADERTEQVANLQSKFLEDLKKIANSDHIDGCALSEISVCTCGVRNASFLVQLLIDRPLRINGG